MDMEFTQFHPTGMVWPPSVRGTLVTEGVRGDGGVLKNSTGERFMFGYIPEKFAAETADTVEEADRWLVDSTKNRRPPELLTRDVVARAITREVVEGRGSPHGGVFLDIASRRDPDFIRRKLPSMYHQFKELAGVDITQEPMEVGPTLHYFMGGIRVHADTDVVRAGSLRCRRVLEAHGGPTASAATRSPTCWSSASSPASARATTCADSARRRRSTRRRWTPRRSARRRRSIGGRLQPVRRHRPPPARDGPLREHRPPEGRAGDGGRQLEN
jgi:hypothetical protein